MEAKHWDSITSPGRPLPPWTCLQKFFYQEVIHMPMYEYKCLDCGKESEVALSISDRQSRQVTCPHCKSKRMEQVFTSVMAKTSRKS